MGKQQLTSEPIDDSEVADLEKLAAEWGCTREHLVATAVLRFLTEETRHWPGEFDHLPPYVETDPLAVALGEAEEKVRAAFKAYMKPAENDIEAGRLIDHEEFMREMRARYEARDAAE